MKSLTGLWKVMAEDYSAICDTPIDRDYKTVVDRVECEGVSFLTITLPAFASDFEQALRDGGVGSNFFLGFKRRKGGLPAFLSGFLTQIFDGVSLKVLVDPNPFAVKAVRQLCLLFKKVELTCTDARNAKALNQYLQCEEELKQVDEQLSLEDRKIFRTTAAHLFSSVFDRVDDKVRAFDLEPKHGPGATADKKAGNEKFAHEVWTERLEEYFPFGEYALPHWKFFKDYAPVFLTPEQEQPTKITLVPKTLKTPRIIAIEPTCMQYMQQALMREFVREIECDPLVSHVTHFTDQSLNQQAARSASVDGRLATLDLSEASDRVLNSLVIDMLNAWPDLSGAVQACRTTRSELPDGTIVPLAKFASMGSALTFPMEAMVFTTIVAIGLAKAHCRKPWDAENLRALKAYTHVYGDDMIVPVDSVNDIIGSLETYGLRVNHTKSFWTGMFRESCGGDYFNGLRVTPLRLKQVPPMSHQNVSEILSWNALMNASYEDGLERTGDWMKRYLEGVLGNTLPEVPFNSAAIGIRAWAPKPERMNPNTHRPEVRAWVPDVRLPSNSVNDIWALRKTLTADWSDPVYKKHLTHSGRPLASRMKRAWVPTG